MKARALTVLVLVAMASSPAFAVLNYGDSLIAGWSWMKIGRHNGTFGSETWYNTQGQPNEHSGGGGVAITYEKRVFLTDWDYKVVYELDENANMVDPAFINYPTDVNLNNLLLDSAENIYAGCSDGKVRKYSPTGADLGVYADIGAYSIGDMAWGSDPGVLYISETSYTGRLFKTDGATTSQFAQVNYTGAGIAVSGGYIFANNGNARQMYKFQESDLTQVGDPATITTDNMYPRGMDTGPDEQIYMAIQAGAVAGLVMDLDMTSFGQYGGAKVANEGEICFVPLSGPIRTWRGDR